MIIKKIIIFSFLFSLCLGLGINANAGIDNAFDSGSNSLLGQAANGAGYKVDKGEEQIDEVLGLVIRSLLTFLGVIFLVLMIYGGFLWMTDRGNEDQVKKARNLIIAAVTGLIIVLSAYAISIFVVGQLTATSLE